MATLISAGTGSALSTGKPRLRLPMSVTVTGLVAHLSIEVPAGVSQILIWGRAGIGGLYSVTEATTEVIELTRDEPDLSEHPHVVIAVEALGYRSNAIKLKFEREDGQVGVPVTLTTAGSMSAGTAAGTALTYTHYVWAGDVSALEDTIWTSPDNVTYTDTGERWTSIAYTTSVWFKRRARAYGPTVANPLINDWTAYQETTPRQITARPAARTLVAGVDFEIDRSEYRPGTQSTWRTPIVEVLTPLIGQAFELRATAADVSNPSPTWSDLTPRPGEANRFDMYDPGHPVSSPSADAALFSDPPGTNRAGRFSVSWRRDELEPWSARSTGINVPAVVTTGDPDANYTVSTLADLVTAMNAATSGQVIAVQPGTYAGAISFQNKNKGNPGITIRPVNRANPPIFLNGTINLSGSTGITFDGTTHRNTVMDTDPNWYPDGVYTFPLSGNRAFTFDDTVRFTLRNCIIEGHHMSLGQRRTTDLLIEYCHFRLCGMDSIRLYDGHVRPVIRNNLFNDPNVDHRRVREIIGGTEPRHVDFIQFANNVNGPGCVDFVIENNAFYGSYGYHQCIFMLNERTTRNPADTGGGTPTLAANGHNNGIVRGNYMESRHEHAIFISGAQNILVEGNLVRTKLPSSTPNAQNAAPPPQIGVSGSANTGCYSTGIVRNNVHPPKNGAGDNSLSLASGGVIASNQSLLTRTGNKRSDTAVPPGWVMPAVGPYAFDAATGPTVVRSWLKPRWFLSGSGTQTVATAGVFTSAVASYSLVGTPPAGVTINATTGVVSVTTGSAYAWAEITIRGTNAAGGTTDVTMDLRVITPNHTVAANAALTSVSPTAGQIVVYRGGTNTSLVDIGGWPNNVEVYAYPGETPIIDVSSRTQDVGVKLGATNGIKLYGLDVRGGPNVDVGIAGWGCLNTVISCCSISGFNRFGISTNFTDHSAARPWIIEYNRVFGNTLENIAHTWSGGWGRGIGLDVADNSIVRRNWVYENHGEGIGVLACNGVTVTENYIWDNYSVNLYFDGARTTTATANVIWSNNPAFYRNFPGGIDVPEPAKSVMSANEDYDSDNHLEQSTISLSVTGNFILASNAMPFHDSSFGMGTAATSSVFTPNATFAAPLAAWES